MVAMLQEGTISLVETPDTPAHPDRMDLSGAVRLVVQHHWNDWHAASVYLADVQDVHWREPLGTVQPLLHAYVSCDAIQSGRLPHRCDSPSGPHRLLVCLIRRHMTDRLYAELALRADEYRDAHQRSAMDCAGAFVND
jgi:hypothetical protein